MEDREATAEDLREVQEQLSRTALDPNAVLVTHGASWYPLDDLPGQQYFDFMAEHVGSTPIAIGQRKRK